MDSYGVIQVGDHLLSLLGLGIYLAVLGLGFWMVKMLTVHIPRRYRLLNFTMYWLAVLAIVSWGFKALGLWFYVEA
jgi:hypothetical protein